MTGSAVIMAMGVVSGILAARLLGSQGRGELAVLLMVPSLTIRLGNMSLIQAVAHCANRGMSSLGASALTFAVALGLVECACVAPFLFLLTPQLSPSEHTAALWLMGVVPVTYAVYVLLGLDLGAADFLRYSLYQALPVLLYVPLLGLVALSGKASAMAFAFANLGAWALVAGCRFPELTRLAAGGRARWATFMWLLRGGVAFSFPELAGLALQRMDYPILAQLVSKDQIGLYTVALAVAGGQAAVASPISQVCFSASSSGRNGGAASLAAQFRLFQIVFFFTAVGVILVAPVLIHVAFGVQFLTAAATARWLIVAMALWSSSQTLDGGMRGLGLSGLSALSNLGGLIVALSSSFWLVKHSGIAGMGLAMCTGQGVALVLKAVLFGRSTGLGVSDLWGLNEATVMEVVRVVRVELKALLAKRHRKKG